MWPYLDRRAVATVSILFGMVLATACTSVGPTTLDRDSYRYNDALDSAWKRQMLLNMVKIRYGDAPVFLDVTSMINQYSLEGQVNLNAPGWDRPSGVGPPIGGAAGRWADRPTITYVPVAGEKFTRSLLTPIPPVSLLAMVQSGWPIEFVFGMAVRTINGIANGARSNLLRQEPDPLFGDLLSSLVEIQRSSAIGMRIDRLRGDRVAVIVLQRGEIGPVEEARRNVRGILQLERDTDEFEIRYGSIPETSSEIAMLTRSILEIIGEFSFGIEVPLRHVEEGRVLAAPGFDGPWSPPSVRICSGDDEPDDAFVAIRYRGVWFWIDDRDFPAKRMFSFLLLLTSLAESGTTPAAPLITVGAGS
jgi:hypothetical protein